jgi:hypothetical protein
VKTDFIKFSTRFTTISNDPANIWAFGDFYSDPHLNSFQSQTTNYRNQVTSAANQHGGLSFMHQEVPPGLYSDPPFNHCDQVGWRPNHPATSSFNPNMNQTWPTHLSPGDNHETDFTGGTGTTTHEYHHPST